MNLKMTDLIKGTILSDGVLDEKLRPPGELEKEIEELVDRLSRLSFSDMAVHEISFIPLPKSDNDDTDCESELSDEYLIDTDTDYIELKNVIRTGYESEALSEFSFHSNFCGSDTIQFIDESEEDESSSKNQDEARIDQPITEVDLSLSLNESDVIDRRTYSSCSGSFTSWSTASLEEELQFVQNMSLRTESDFLSTTNDANHPSEENVCSNLTSSPTSSICSLVVRLDLMTETFEQSLAELERKKRDEEAILKRLLDEELLKKAESEKEILLNIEQRLSPNLSPNKLNEELCTKQVTPSPNVSFVSLMDELDSMRESFKLSFEQLLDEDSRNKVVGETENLQQLSLSPNVSLGSLADELDFKAFSEMERKNREEEELRKKAESEKKSRPSMKVRLIAPRQLRCAVRKPDVEKSVESVDKVTPVCDDPQPNFVGKTFEKEEINISPNRATTPNNNSKSKVLNSPISRALPSTERIKLMLSQYTKNREEEARKIKCLQNKREYAVSIRVSNTYSVDFLLGLRDSPLSVVAPPEQRNHNGHRQQFLKPFLYSVQFLQSLRNQLPSNRSPSIKHHFVYCKIKKFKANPQSLLSRQMNQIQEIFEGRRTHPEMAQRKLSNSQSSIITASDDQLKTSAAKRVGYYDLKMEHNLTYVTQQHFSKSSGDGVRDQSLAFCYVCNQHFDMKVLLFNHIERVHGEYFVIPSHVTKSKCSRRFEVSFIDDDRKTKDETIQMLVKNRHDLALNMYKMFVIHANKYKRIDISYKSRKFYPGDQYQFALQLNSLATDDNYQSILLFFSCDDKDYIEQHYIRIKRDRIAYWKKNPPRRELVINPIRPFRLPEYKPLPEIIKVFNRKFQIDNSFTEKEIEICNEITNFARASSRTRLNPTNYATMMSYCIQISDCSQERSMMVFDKEQQKLQLISKQHYAIKIGENSDLPQELSEFDYVALSVVSEAGLQPTVEKVLAMVVKIESDSIIIRTTEDNDKQVHVGSTYKLRFKSNRVPFKMEHQAITIIDEENLSKFLFPTTPSTITCTTKIHDWFDPLIATNPEQTQAVEHIVAGTAKPSPYIIFGPPGTGKTSVIVETICQLWKRLPTSKILVTAQSNAACNEVTHRLLKWLPANDLYRLFAPSMEKKFESIDDELLAISNLKHGTHQYPNWENFYKFRIVVCTLTSAGRLVQAKVRRHHFTHVFIDECGSATEMSSLIPIAGIVTTKNCISGQVILAGDIKQLGPIVMSRTAESMGYGIPLMERLMDLPIYQKDPDTKSYNPRMITKLIRSFRSHPKIIEFPNQAFYDGDLQASGLPETTQWAINWKELPNPAIPIIMVPCDGESQKDEGGFSPYNMREIEMIMQYVNLMLSNGINGREITQQDIGIISPYKKQAQKIRQACEKRELDSIECGTVEMFQGREKPIIIISTVRSRVPTMGFLNNPKRLNVTITRAKALMIIIGNPYTLKKDPYWFDLLKYCWDNDCCVTPIQLGQSRRLAIDRAGALEEESLDILWDEFEADGKKMAQNVVIEDFF